MQCITIYKFSELKKFLNNDLNYTIEPFIPNCEIKIIQLGKYILRVLKDDNNNYYNLHCIKRIQPLKELNGQKEYNNYQIGNMIFKKYKKDNLKTIERVKLTRTNYYKMKLNYNILVLKNINQIFYENTLVWDWIKIL